MSGIPDFTILVAADQSHIEELRLSYATWARHKPSLLRRPMLIVYDDESGQSHLPDWLARLSFIGHSDAAFIPASSCLPWNDSPPGRNTPRDISQREKMLTTLVFAVQHIETPYYLKLDCDTICTGPDDWIDPAWFDGSPAIIAPRWGYTKPYTMLDDLDRWAEGNSLSAGPRVRRATQWPSDGSIRSRIAKHPRFISYCQFGEAEWTRRMAALAGNRLPCPSQDTFLSYCAVRSGALVRTVDMKARGWRHVGSNINRLRAAAAEAMEAPVT